MLNTHPSRRRFVAGLHASAALALFGCSAGPARGQVSGGVLRSSQFPDLASAFARWGLAGGTLVIDRDANLTRPVTVTLQQDLSYRLTTDVARTISYAGPRFHWALCLLATGGNRLTIDGNITINGGNRVVMPLFARFENVLGSARRDCIVSGLTCTNARMVAGRSPVDGSPTNAYGASAMMFMGGFDRLTLQSVTAADVTRAAGAGRRGSQGCTGIAVVALMGTTASARHVTIDGFSVSNVDSEDAWTSQARGDMDGVLVFQSAEAASTAPVIRNGRIVNAAGRGIKVFAPGGGGLTELICIERSVPGPIDGAVDIAHQNGEGTISDIDITYSGAAHANPSTVIGMSTNNPRPREFAMGHGTVYNVRIHDTTGATKKAVLGIQQFNPADRAERQFTFGGIRDNGASDFLFLPGSLGEYSKADIAIANVQVNLRTALFASEDRNRALTVSMSNTILSQRGEVPVKTMYDKRPVVTQLRVTPLRAGRVVGLAQ